MADLLNNDELARYARHIVLKGIGAAGQLKLKRAKVLVIGAGGLGSPVIAYLAAAGVGGLSIVDDDVVDVSNLQRQIVHDTGRIGDKKVESGKKFARELNPHVRINAIADRFDRENGAEMVKHHDVVVEGADRFSTRRVIADICQSSKTPLVSGAVSMFDGQVSVFAPHLGNSQGHALPTFSCLYPDDHDDADLPACEVNGILGATTGVIGTLMAMEVIKLITDLGEPLFGRLLLYDGRNAKFNELNYARRAPIF